MKSYKCSVRVFSVFQCLMLIIKNHIINTILRYRFGSYFLVGDVVEMEDVNPYTNEGLGTTKIYTIEKVFIAPNAQTDRPTEIVVVLKLSYKEGKSSVECTSDRFKYIKHLYPSEKQVNKRLKNL